MQRIDSRHNGHGLMQASARVNRVFQGQVGLVVDYPGQENGKGRCAHSQDFALAVPVAFFHAVSCGAPDHLARDGIGWCDRYLRPRRHGEECERLWRGARIIGRLAFLLRCA